MKTDREEAVLVSACLLGERCRYDGQTKTNGRIRVLKEKGTRFIPVCPECLGGLPTPRPPAEIQEDGRVVNREGRDVTREYLAGAREALRICREAGCRTAVLKARSPSCGRGAVYDGTFSGRLVPGDGCAARMLSENGVRVLTEEELDAL